MRTGIVVCTRMKSSRIPNKVTRKLNNIPVLEHLHNRLIKTGIPTVYAYPMSDAMAYNELFYNFENKDFKTTFGYDNDPLKRMHKAACEYDLDIIIRVVHDKIFIDDKQLLMALGEFKKRKLDYLYSTTFTDGTAFEIISRRALTKAAKSFDKVEHITYAVKAITTNSYNMDQGFLYAKDIRLLIDYPKDLDLMTTIFACLGNDCTQVDALVFMADNPWAKEINKLPKVTVYTCGFNAEKYLREAMNSVITQDNFIDEYEYILVDDFSSDKTAIMMAEFAATLPNVTYIRNTKNLGLASSSNVALSRARGKYIIRLDADDYFVGNNCINYMIKKMNEIEVDALYPNYYKGNYQTIGPAALNHHPAGTLFKTIALNHIRFKDGLRHYDGTELYLRAKDILKIGYLSRPIFFYRQHDASLSRNNLTERALIKENIENNRGYLN